MLSHYNLVANVYQLIGPNAVDAQFATTPFSAAFRSTTSTD